MTELFLVLGTWALVVVTICMAVSQSRMQRSDLQVRLQLTFIERWDGLLMLNGRMRAAQYFLSETSEEWSETVPNFFDDLGAFHSRGFLDEELIWRTFGYYGVRWWFASRDYILEERRDKDDNTIFDDFETLVKVFLTRDRRNGIPEPTSEQIKVFLHDELSP
jgi:hypothetical protein